MSWVLQMGYGGVAWLAGCSAALGQIQVVSMEAATADVTYVQ